MKRVWTEEELNLSWRIWPQEAPLIEAKRGKTRLGFAVLLKAFQFEGQFPQDPSDIPAPALAFVATQLGTSPEEISDYAWEGRTIERHRAEIRKWCGFREFSLADQDELKTWLILEAIPQEHRSERLREALIQRCRNLRVEPPTADRSQLLLNSALQAHEKGFTESVFQGLSQKVLDRLDALLQVPPSDEEAVWTPWQTLKADPGRAGIESVKKTGVRLHDLKAVGLPTGLFRDVPPKLIERYAKRATPPSFMQIEPRGNLKPVLG